MRRLVRSLGNQYEVHDLLGRGGMGAVFLATDKKLDRRVAIKVLPPELAVVPEVGERFEREARTAAKLDHPNIIPIYAVEDEDDLKYFIMKYVEGHSLDDELVGNHPVAWTRAQEVLVEAARALSHAHSRGIVHRDIKPGNIMIERDGRILLADFGISKAQEAATKFTATGMVLGTPAYMSPEQAEGVAVDGRSDQYSLAMVGYRMLAGRLPFDESSIASMLYKQIFTEPAPLSDLCPDAPAFLTDAIHRALAKSPDDRFATMDDFAAALGGASSGVSSRGVVPRGAVPQSTDATIVMGRSSRLRAIMIGVASTLIVGIAAVVLVTQTNGDASVETSAETGIEVAAVPSTQPPAPVDPVQGSITTDSAKTPPAQGVAEVGRSPSPPSSPPVAPVQERPAAPVPAVGFLTVGATPWGTVLIDGVEMGNTPLTRHQLPPGQYVVEVQRLGYQSTIDTVVITPSNSTILRKVLIPQL